MLISCILYVGGVFRGAANNECNLNYMCLRTIPVAFHNMSNYDAHIIIKDIAHCAEGSIHIILENTEKYIAITKSVDDSTVKFRFIDTFRLMASSLEKLASYLPDYPILRQQMQHLTEAQIQLITRKGVFPYDYLDSWDKLNDTALPTKDKFRSLLTGNDISDAEYAYALEVSRRLGITNLAEYAALYMQGDVLLLADV